MSPRPARRAGESAAKPVAPGGDIDAAPRAHDPPGGEVDAAPREHDPPDPEPDPDAAPEPVQHAPPRGRVSAGQAIYLYGVSRVRGWRPTSFRRQDDLQQIRYRDLEALVRTVHYEVPVLDEARVLEHQRVIERAMRRATVLPAPYGIVFRGRRQLIRMLEDQYLVLDEGLAFLEGHWEMRVHLRTTDPLLESQLGDAALQLYAELRSSARAAVPFPRESNRLLGAAFLVERTGWLEFMERAEQLAASYPGLTLDVTGPWPPYDFVRVTR